MNFEKQIIIGPLHILSQELRVRFCAVGNEPIALSDAAHAGISDVLHSYASGGTAGSACISHIFEQHFQTLFFEMETGFASCFAWEEVRASLAEALLSHLPSV